jgi:hypothetical protein
MPADGQLSLRRLGVSSNGFATVYDHPDFGKLDVGRITERSGNPFDTDKWAWSIGYSTLPGRYWLQGTAPTRKAAEAEWKRNWPKFRDARSEADWHDARESQDQSRKKIDIFDAGQKPISKEERLALREEAMRKGPTPEWVKAILRRGT